MRRYLLTLIVLITLYILACEIALSQAIDLTGADILNMFLYLIFRPIPPFHFQQFRYHIIRKPSADRLCGDIPDLRSYPNLSFLTGPKKPIFFDFLEVIIFRIINGLLL